MGMRAEDAATGEPEPGAEAEPSVEVRRRAGLLAVVGVLAAGLSLAYLDRAMGSGSALDWALMAVLALIGATHLIGLVDARTPLLVADATGARVRSGRTWTGVVWADVERVEHTPRRGPWRDGRLALVPGVGEEDAQTLVVPLGLATRLSVPEAELDARLAGLSGGLAADHPNPPSRWRDPRPALAQSIARVASATPAPLRSVRAGQRADVTLGSLALALDRSVEEHTLPLPETAELHRPEPTVDDDIHAWAGSRAGEPEPADEAVTAVIEPTPDPVVGPQLVAARRRIGLGVDELADRTRIRPHVIEAIEVDDFGPCGGDFYARGHLRTLARVLGIDAATLLSAYDELYAHAPISPRRVFEAELASGSHGSIRGTRGGPNWSVLVAALMTVVLAWSLARLAMDGPVEITQVPGLGAGSGGVSQGGGPAGAAVPVLLRAAGGGAHVVVRDADGRIAFSGDLAYGASRSLKVAAPIKVESSDGSVEIVVDGDDRGPVGDTGRPASATYAAD